MHYYDGSPFAAAGYTRYTGAPFTPACKQMDASKCSVGSGLIPGIRVLTLETALGAATDSAEISPTFVYSPPQCASSAAEAAVAIAAQQAAAAAGAVFDVNAMWEDDDDDDARSKNPRIKNRGMIAGISIGCLCFIVCICVLANTEES